MKKNTLSYGINKFVNKFGLEIHRHIPEKRAGSLRSMYDVCVHAKKCGMVINSVFDVGVASGTPELYDSFPSAKFILVEPLFEFTENIEQILKNFDGIAINAAASDYSGKANIQVSKNNLDGTSFYLNSTPTEQNELREINVITLDELAKRYLIKPPYLIKADVQGYEINVLNGAKHILCDTEMVILETSFYEFLPNTPQFFDVIVEMKKLGFVVYDFIGGAIRPLDGSLGQIDVAFVKEYGSLRTDHSYGSY